MLDARQLAEVYAFAKIEPLDQPLQKMIAELTAVLAKVNGNDMSAADFMLSRPVETAVPTDDKTLRTQQIAQMFARAAKQNSKVH